MEMQTRMSHANDARIETFWSSVEARAAFCAAVTGRGCSAHLPGAGAQGPAPEPRGGWRRPRALGKKTSRCGQSFRCFHLASSISRCLPRTVLPTGGAGLDSVQDTITLTLFRAQKTDLCLWPFQWWRNRPCRVSSAPNVLWSLASPAMCFLPPGWDDSPGDVGLPGTEPDPPWTYIIDHWSVNRVYNEWTKIRRLLLPWNSLLRNVFAFCVYLKVHNQRVGK